MGGAGGPSAQPIANAVAPQYRKQPIANAVAPQYRKATRQPVVISATKIGEAGESSRNARTQGVIIGRPAFTPLAPPNPKDVPRVRHFSGLHASDDASKATVSQQTIKGA